jgi:hypothetical protein
VEIELNNYSYEVITMCSSPRASGSMKKIHRLLTSRAHFKSQAQMMRGASEIYDRKQEKQAKAKQQKQYDNHNDNSVKEHISIQESVEIIIPAMENAPTTKKSVLESIRQFISFMREKIPPIVTT